jgi:uncharacterized membrane protein YbhN (UPF0104 family)
MARVPRPVVPTFGRGIDFLDTVSTFFAGAPGLLVLAIALSALAICTTFARGLLAAHFLRLPLGVGEIALLLAFSLVVVAIPFFPGALGIYEGGMVGFFQLLGRPAAEGIAYAMVVHGVELIVAAVGLVFLAHLGVGLATMRAVDPTDRGVA